MPADVFPLQLGHGAVIMESRSTIIEGMPDSMFAKSDTDHGALLLGFKSTGGPKSLVDICLEKVSEPEGAHSYDHSYDLNVFDSVQVKVKHMLACARCKLWWMTPEWRTSTLQLPPETQFLLSELQSPPGEPKVYTLLLPLIDGSFRSTIRAGR
jgi:hypothetical protein